MIIDPHLLLDLYATRAAELAADAAHDRVARALRRNASTVDAPPARRWPWRRRDVWS